MYRISDLIQNYKYVCLQLTPSDHMQLNRMSGLYKVEKIVGKRIRDSTVEYKVKWKNYDSTQNTWEPLKNLKNVEDMIKEFEKRNKDRLPQLPEQKMQNRSERTALTLQNKPDLKIDKPISKKNELINTAKKHSGKHPKRDFVIKKSNPRTISSQNESRQDDLDINSKQFQKSQEPALQFEDMQLDHHIQGLDLNKIVSKIIVAVQEKVKTYKIIQIQKRSPKQGNLYIVKDSDGNEHHKTRQQVLRDHPLQLIAFLEQKVQFKPAKQ